MTTAKPFASEDVSEFVPPGPRADFRKALRRIKTLAAAGKWHEVIKVADASDYSCDYRLIEYRIRSALELNDAKEIEKCLQKVKSVEIASERVKLASILVNANRPREAAEVMGTIPAEYQSGKATNVARRVRATTADKAALLSIKHLVRAKNPRGGGDTPPKIRYPGDSENFSVPPSNLKTVRLRGVSAEIEEYVQNAWNRFGERFKSKPYPYVIEYSDVFVNKEGQVWTTDGTALRVTNLPLPESVDHASVRNYDNAFSCVGGSRGYYDWIVDRLAKISWALAPETPQCAILLRKEQHSLAVDALGALGVGESSIVLLEDTVFCRKLYVGSSSNVAIARKSAYQHSYGRLIELAALSDDGTSPRRFYISRRDSKRRAMINEEDFEKKLAKVGVVPVILSKLTLLQKINLFRNAEVVVAAHGAGLSHLLFAKPGLEVIELMPASMNQLTQLGIRLCFSMLSKVAGLNHTMILYPVNLSTSSWSAEPDLIASVLKKLEES